MRPECRYQEDPYIIEVPKSSEILDYLGNVRFIVSIQTSEDLDSGYTVTVKAQDEESEDSTLIKEDFELYDDAVAFFKQTVDQYQRLLKAETYDKQDIRLYACRTGYHNIDPDCCMTCKWAKPLSADEIFGDYELSSYCRFTCTNSDLYMPPTALSCSEYDEPDRREPYLSVELIRPVVEAYGLCRGFERLDCI